MLIRLHRNEKRKIPERYLTVKQYLFYHRVFDIMTRENQSKILRLIDSIKCYLDMCAYPDIVYKIGGSKRRDVYYVDRDMPILQHFKGRQISTKVTREGYVPPEGYWTIEEYIKRHAMTFKVFFRLIWEGKKVKGMKVDSDCNVIIPKGTPWIEPQGKRDKRQYNATKMKNVNEMATVLSAAGWVRCKDWMKRYELTNDTLKYLKRKDPNFRQSYMRIGLFTYVNGAYEFPKGYLEVRGRCRAIRLEFMKTGIRKHPPRPKPTLSKKFIHSQVYEEGLTQHQFAEKYGIPMFKMRQIISFLVRAKYSGLIKRGWGFYIIPKCYNYTRFFEVYGLSFKTFTQPIEEVREMVKEYYERIKREWEAGTLVDLDKPKCHPRFKKYKKREKPNV